MSYDLKYRSNFYNIFGKAVHVKIYKKDYGEHDTIYLRTDEVTVEVNYENKNTPIVGTVASISFRNENEFTYLDDLLKSEEKQFECIIVYDNTIVFDGFSICDLNEQEFIPFSRVTILFTDYIRKCQGEYFAALAKVGQASRLIDLIFEMMTKVGASKNLHVNSSLFETRMNSGPNDTFLEQTYLENYMFYSDANLYDNMYVALNKALKSFNAFLYSCGDKWILERYDDITRNPLDQTWVVFTGDFSGIGQASANLRQLFHKQSDHFKYTELRQNVTYDSGLQKLILKLNDKQLETLVFNDYKASDIFKTSDQFPTYSVLALKKWYTYTTNTIVRTGIVFRSMSNFIEWKCDLGRNFEFDGLYYHFKVTFNQPSSLVVNPDLEPEMPTILNISFKQSQGRADLTPIKTVTNRFCIMIGGWYLAEQTDPVGNTFWGLTSEPTAIRRDTDVSSTGNKDLVQSINESINLTDPIAVSPIENQDPVYMPSIWEYLGKPEVIDCVVQFFPSVLFGKGNPSPRFQWSDNYIGDVQIGVAAQKIPNKLTYYINASFIKTDSVDIDFFDIENDNFANGPKIMLEGFPEGVRTKLWKTHQHPVPLPLMDQYARVVFGNYCHTLHKLQAPILHDGYIKPFAILTDDNLKDDNGDVIKLIVCGYIWDLNTGIYDIKQAIEYTEEIVPEESSSSSGGGPVIPFVTVTPETQKWDYNETGVKTFVVETNLDRWYFASNNVLGSFNVSVWNSTNTVEITNGIYTSGMVVRVQPIGVNGTGSILFCEINIANESNETMASFVGRQGYSGYENPPIISPVANDLILTNFDSSLHTGESNLWIQWTPTMSGLTDYTLYIEVTRGGVRKGYVQFPHNTDGVSKTMWIPLNEASIGGATYIVTFRISHA